MIWEQSNSFSDLSREIADRHYNRQKPGTPRFVPPGRCLVLRAETPTGKALWVTSWPFAEYTRHEWAGAWICSAFRNEGAGCASDLIRDAVAGTKTFFGEPPSLGMVTFVDHTKVKPTRVRGRNVWGWTYRKAGFRECGETKVNKLLALQLLPQDMPDAAPWAGMQQNLEFNQ